MAEHLSTSSVWAGVVKASLAGAPGFTVRLSVPGLNPVLEAVPDTLPTRVALTKKDTLLWPPVRVTVGAAVEQLLAVEKVMFAPGVRVIV
jgi:hypothetical protein